MNSFDQGFRAFCAGLPVGANPHSLPSIDYDEWESGWIASQEVDIT